MKKQILFLMIMAVSIGFIHAQTITVNLPNSSNTWNAGGTYDITWIAVGSMDANVKIRLMKGHGGLEDLVLAITESTPTNAGAYTWTIPASVTRGAYLIRVKTVDNAVGDDGEFFKLAPYPGPATITVNSPARGITWYTGDTYHITWTPVGTMNANVKIRLMKGFGPDDLILPITESTPNNGSFSWTIPAMVASRPYLIRVKTVDNDITGNSRIFKIATEIGPLPFKQADLTVSELTYTMRNAPPRSCDTITKVRVKAKIKNIGTLGCNKVSHARLTIAGPEGFQKIVKTFLISKLAKNDSDTISWEYTPYTYGIYKYEVEVDINNNLNESSENNNKKKKLLGVNPLPDLVVCVSCGKRPPVGGKRDVHAWVKNIGQFDAVNFRLKFYIKQKGTTHHTISRLKPGKMVKITRDHRWGTAGSKNIIARVDCDGTVREMRENNNFVKSKYFVRLPHHGNAAHNKSCLEGYFNTETSINESHCCSYTLAQAVASGKLKVKIK